MKKYTQAQVAKLCKKAQKGDKEAREKMILANRGLVYFAINR